MRVAIGITEKGRIAAEGLAFARYAMFAAVYWHHTSRAIKAMLHFAVWNVLADLEEGDDEETGGVEEDGKERFGTELFNVAIGKGTPPSRMSTQLGLFAVEGTAVSDRINEGDERLLLWLGRQGADESRVMIDSLLSRRFYKRVFTLGAQEDSRLFADLIRLSSEETQAVRMALEEALRERLWEGVTLPIETGAPIVLLDVPRRRMPDEPLYYIEDREGHAMVLRTSGVWQQLYERFIETAGRVRIFAHPKLEAEIEARVPRKHLKEMLTKAIEQVESLKFALKRERRRRPRPRGKGREPGGTLF